MLPNSSVQPKLKTVINRFLFIALLVLAGVSAQAGERFVFPTYGPVIPGSKACLVFGIAFAPSEAPMAVKRAIWAANQLRSKPYRYGGGHRSFVDRGYDCSGTVSYALGAAGVVRSPMSSSELRRFGREGKGKWITIYARNGHAFAVIAGLRLDTTAWNELVPNHRWAPRWQLTYRKPRGFVARHPAGL